MGSEDLCCHFFGVVKGSEELSVTQSEGLFCGIFAVVHHSFFKIKQIRSANHSQTLVTWADNYKIKIKEIKEKLDLI